MSRSPRLDYDKIADLYDSQPYRSRSADLELLAFARERISRKSLQAISEADYTAGVRRLASALADLTAARGRADHLCLVTIRGEKR